MVTNTLESGKEVALKNTNGRRKLILKVTPLAF